MRPTTDQTKCDEAAYLQVSVHDSPGMYVFHTFQYLPQQAECVLSINAPIRT